MPTALLREVADTFDNAIITHGARAPDVARARSQHQTYATALGEAGYTVETLPADNNHPDCVFVEDTAVVLGDVAMATRPGAASRLGEVGPVAEYLETKLAIVSMEAPGTLDGGDVMIAGGLIFVGSSSRTNDEGIAQLAEVAADQGMAIRVVPVRGVLHLKSAVLPVDRETVVVTPGTVDETLLDGLRIVHEAPRERHAFSALMMSNGDVLVTDAAPDTAAAVADLGLTIRPIDVSEIQAADGGLTCMSILIEGE
jgi:dimethylargininase